MSHGPCHNLISSADPPRLLSVTASPPRAHVPACLPGCRDVADEIRAVVVAALGAWVADAPGTYLTDAHLKYLAWALSDRVGRGVEGTGEVHSVRGGHTGISSAHGGRAQRLLPAVQPTSMLHLVYMGSAVGLVDTHQAPSHACTASYSVQGPMAWNSTNLLRYLHGCLFCGWPGYRMPECGWRRSRR